MLVFDDHGRRMPVFVRGWWGPGGMVWGYGSRVRVCECEMGALGLMSGEREGEFDVDETAEGGAGGGWWSGELEGWWGH